MNKAYLKISFEDCWSACIVLPSGRETAEFYSKRDGFTAANVLFTWNKINAEDHSRIMGKITECRLPDETPVDDDIFPDIGGMASDDELVGMFVIMKGVLTTPQEESLDDLTERLRTPAYLN